MKEDTKNNVRDWTEEDEKIFAEKAIEENNKLLPAAFARILKEETEALAKMLPNNKQNNEIMKENIEKEPPTTSYGKCTNLNKDCKYRKDGKCPDAPMAIHFCRNCSDEDLQKAEEFANALPNALKQIAEEKTDNIKDDTTVFVVSSKFCGDFFIDAAFSTKQQAEDFITQHEMSSSYITELTIDKPSEYTEDIPFRPAPRQDERVNHPKHYYHPSGVECITPATHSNTSSEQVSNKNKASPKQTNK